jgi:phage baseplate assembly protein W
VSQEIIVPFGLDTYGRVAVTGDPVIQAMQHVKALVATEPGERVMLPRYGVALKERVFAPGLSADAARINNDVTMAMAAWEPGLTVISITPRADDNNGVAMVDVDFTRGAANSPGSVPALTATILVGGTVVEGTSP